MSLRQQYVSPVPDETARVARASFPNGNLYLQLRDDIGILLGDEDLAHLFPTRGQPAYSPWRLALITIFQFIENLSDRAAADSVRARIDWKYALSLELENPGFDSSVLCEFRARLVAGKAENTFFDKLLEWCRERKLLKTRGRQRTDSTHVLAAVRGLNRIECVLETMRQALNAVAREAPAWLEQLFQAEWWQRYSLRGGYARIPHSVAGRQEFALLLGRDAHALLDAVYEWSGLLDDRTLPALETLRRVVLQQYYVDAAGIHWRTAAEGLPPTVSFINSPSDLEAHYGKKRDLQWTGYKVYLTETCDDDLPRLVTNVETSTAPVADCLMTGPIQQALAQQELLPAVQLVDTGFVNAELLLSAQTQYGIDLCGPAHLDHQWQSRHNPAFSSDQFKIDWGLKEALCPAGKTSSSWSEATTGTAKPVIKIKFSTTDCQVCACRPDCTKSKRVRRTLTILPRPQYEAQRQARERTQTQEYRQAYRRRAGIEGTISQGVRGFGMRRSRYVGEAKTHLQQVMSATAMNAQRVIRWLQEIPLAQTRQPLFVRVMREAAA